MAEPTQHPHLLISGTETTLPFTTTRPARGKTRLPLRDRMAHGARLQAELDRALREARAAAVRGPRKSGIYLEFESEPGFDLKLKSLDSAAAGGIELVAVRDLTNERGDVRAATVFVPDGRTGHFTRILGEYLDTSRESPGGKPLHQPLVDGIAAIRRAALRAFWTDVEEAWPAPGERIAWEVWLRGDDTAVERFNAFADQVGIAVSRHPLEFPDRRVVLAVATTEQLSSSVDVLDALAEVRRAKDTAGEFLALTVEEQREWADDLAGRVVPPSPDTPAVCLLDTGVFRLHPLLAPALPGTSMFACDPDWTVEDHQGHGTMMAGLALYGDLTAVLGGSLPVPLTHGLESVKILPPPGFRPNDRELHGARTLEAAARAELAAPQRRRTYHLAVSAPDARDRGKPSSWSAAVDELASGALDEERRLFVVAAGNTDPATRHFYPDANVTDGIHDPGQAWNALTVGAFTERTLIKDPSFRGWRPVAPPGDLSPCSTTSVLWSPGWPVKPDVVLEGGNQAVEGSAGPAFDVDDLRLLTTYWKPPRPFIDTGDTSAATAQAARLAALIQSQYPQLWPESVRALIVHSARWTDAMQSRFGWMPGRGRHVPPELVRWYGFGVPSLTRALWSAGNALTLVAQASLRPYDREDGKYKTKEMHLHALPWPREALQDLGETQVHLRVTLSYFVEPNPARRGYEQRHRYASHGLRFDVKTPTESPADFQRRINRQAWDEEAGLRRTSRSDAAAWALGPDLRSAGSLHSDSWTGTAAALAARDSIGVFPVIGWWRERPQLGRWNRVVRYALVVSIETPELQADLYTPVANAIRAAAAVAVSGR